MRYGYVKNGIPQPVKVWARNGIFYCNWCDRPHEIEGGYHEIPPCRKGQYKGFNPMIVNGVSVINQEDKGEFDPQLFTINKSRELTNEELTKYTKIRNYWIYYNKKDPIRYFSKIWGINRELVNENIRKDWEKSFMSENPIDWQWALLNARDMWYYRDFLKREYNKKGVAWNNE